MMDVYLCRPPLAQSDETVLFVVSGLPQGISGLRCALSREGYPEANHFGPQGWQGESAWMSPERAWYAHDDLCFILHLPPDRRPPSRPMILRLKIPELPAERRMIFHWPEALPQPQTLPQWQHVTTTLNAGPRHTPWHALLIAALRHPRTLDVVLSLVALTSVLLPLTHMFAGTWFPTSSAENTAVAPPGSQAHHSGTADITAVEPVDVVVWPKPLSPLTLSDPAGNRPSLSHIDELIVEAAIALQASHYDTAVSRCNQAAVQSGEAAMICGRLFNPAHHASEYGAANARLALNYYQLAAQYGWATENDVDMLLDWLADEDTNHTPQ